MTMDRIEFDEKIKMFNEQKKELTTRRDQLEIDTKKFSEEFQDFMKEQFGLEEGKEFHLSDVIIKARSL